MELTIQDDVFLKKIFKRKLRRGIACQDHKKLLLR